MGGHYNLDSPPLVFRSGDPYDHMFAPHRAGSGGACTTSCAGGGAMKIVVAGTLSLQDSITIEANGQTSYDGGGGAGGSIHIVGKIILKYFSS